MFNINVFLIILFIFLLFIIFQVYFYSNIYITNDIKIKEMERFQSTLSGIESNIDNNNDYLLDDTSIELLLSDYNKLKNTL